MGTQDTYEAIMIAITTEGPQYTQLREPLKVEMEIKDLIYNQTRNCSLIVYNIIEGLCKQ